MVAVDGSWEGLDQIATGVGLRSRLLIHENVLVVDNKLSVASYLCSI